MKKNIFFIRPGSNKERRNYGAMIGRNCAILHVYEDRLGGIVAGVMDRLGIMGRKL